ncbi:hypothetical protein GGR56DRAFT_684314 [Xylariaceae sp. FL0804]|nr:hypothetical protein GGR56DRAFT_684314 [Xylariaceae sp. FL0804]
MAKLIATSPESGREIIKRRIRRLEDQQNGIATELQHLRNLLQEPLEESGSSDNPEEQQCTARIQPRTCNNYARPTAASNNRKANASPRMKDMHPNGRVVSVRGQKFRYQNGAIVTEESKSPHYLIPTAAYEHKKTAPARGLKATREADKGFTSWSDPWPEDCTIHSIPSLEDFTEDIFTIDIPSSIQYNLLARALRLAQEILYHCLDKHYHEARVSLYSGPEEVLFGYGDLDRLGTQWLGRIDRQKNVWPKLRYAYATIQAVIPLRNTVCHFSSRTNFQCDRLIDPVQYLAETLGDAERATRARRLRELLRKEAERIAEEIGALGSLAVLPFARPWRSHHEGLFRSMSARSRFTEPRYWPEAVVRAMVHWVESEGQRMSIFHTSEWAERKPVGKEIRRHEQWKMAFNRANPPHPLLPRALLTRAGWNTHALRVVEPARYSSRKNKAASRALSAEHVQPADFDVRGRQAGYILRACGDQRREPDDR